MAVVCPRMCFPLKSHLSPYISRLRIANNFSFCSRFPQEFVYRKSVKIESFRADPWLKKSIGDVFDISGV